MLTQSNILIAGHYMVECDKQVIDGVQYTLFENKRNKVAAIVVYDIDSNNLVSVDTYTNTNEKTPKDLFDYCIEQLKK